MEVTRDESGIGVQVVLDEIVLNPRASSQDKQHSKSACEVVLVRTDPAKVRNEASGQPRSIIKGSQSTSGSCDRGRRCGSTEVGETNPHAGPLKDAVAVQAAKSRSKVPPVKDRIEAVPSVALLAEEIMKRAVEQRDVFVARVEDAERRQLQGGGCGHPVLCQLSRGRRVAKAYRRVGEGTRPVAPNSSQCPCRCRRNGTTMVSQIWPRSHTCHQSCGLWKDGWHRNCELRNALDKTNGSTGSPGRPIMPRKPYRAFPTPSSTFWIATPMTRSFYICASCRLRRSMHSFRRRPATQVECAGVMRTRFWKMSNWR